MTMRTDEHTQAPSMQQLLQDAHLAALGMLDPEEQRSFERTLMSAPHAIRERVLLDQVRWASEGVCLPADLPPAELRDRVLDTIHFAIVDQALGGAGAGGESGGTQKLPWWKPSNPWRASALAMAAAVVALAGSFGYVVQTNRASQAQIAENRFLNGHMGAFGSEFEDALFSPSTTRVVFSPVTGEEGTGKASVFTNADWNASRVVVTDLPSVDGQTYRVVELGSDGTTVSRELATFASGTQNQTLVIPKVSRGTRLAIVLAPAGRSAALGRQLLLATV